MALPSTQKEVTTRRIASLISELWKKIKNAFLLKTSRGAANGVASLDANGKVPTSQLPKIGTSGIEDDAITAALVKDGETLPVNISGSGQLKEYTLNDGTYLIGTLGYDTPSRYGGVIFLATTRDYQDLNNVFLIYLQRGRHVQGTPDDTVSAKATIIDGRVHSINSDGLGFYYNELSDKSTEFYIKVGRSQFVTISLLSNVNGIFNIIEPTSTSLPSSAIEFSYYNNVLMTPGQKGRDSVPVYVNNSGYIVECNKVASLDSNGRIPTGNLPSNSSSSAGIVASGSGQQNRVWGTDSNGNPSWSKVRANMLESNINISGNSLTAGRSLGTDYVTIDNKRYKYLGKTVMTAYTRYCARFQVGPSDGQRNCDILLNVQRNTSSSGSATQLDAVFLANTEGVNLSDLGIYHSYDSATYTYYFYLGVFSNLEFVRCLFSNGFSFDAPSTTPSSLTRIANNRRVILGPTNSGVGSVNTPVYVNSNGVLESCNAALTDKRNFPKLNFFYNGGNSGQTNQYIKVANITCSSRYLNHPFIFRCLSRYQLMYTINIMFQSGDMTRPGLHRFNVEVPVGFSVSTADVKITYDDSGTYRVYTLWVNPGSWTGISTVLECEDEYASLVQITYNQYSTSLTDPITPQYIKYAQSITPGSRIGNESTPIFMEDTGILKACTGGSLINYEVTSAVPSSPTAGKFYFIS